jgi:hypothetical protein
MPSLGLLKDVVVESGVSLVCCHPKCRQAGNKDDQYDEAESRSLVHLRRISLLLSRRQYGSNAPARPVLSVLPVTRPFRVLFDADALLPGLSPSVASMDNRHPEILGATDDEHTRPFQLGQHYRRSSPPCRQA